MSIVMHCSLLSVVIVVCIAVASSATPTVKVEYWNSTGCEGPIVDSDSFPSDTCLPISSSNSSFQWIIGPDSELCAKITYYRANGTNKCAHIEKTISESCNTCDDQDCDPDECSTRAGDDFCDVSHKFQCLPRNKSVVEGFRCKCFSKCQDCKETTTIKVGDCTGTYKGGMIIQSVDKCQHRQVIKKKFNDLDCTGNPVTQTYSDTECANVKGISLKVTVQDD